MLPPDLRQHLFIAAETPLIEHDARGRGGVERFDAGGHGNGHGLPGPELIRQPRSFDTRDQTKGFRETDGRQFPPAHAQGDQGDMVG